MSKAIKQLSEAFERYDITADIVGVADPAKPFGVRVTITILGDAGTFTKRANAECFGAPTAEEAEAEALQKAVDLILGKGPTKAITQYKYFDLTTGVMSTGNKAFPFGMKAKLAIFSDDNKVIRRVEAVSVGTVQEDVEKTVLKNVIAKLGGK